MGQPVYHQHYHYSTTVKDNKYGNHFHNNNVWQKSWKFSGRQKTAYRLRGKSALGPKNSTQAFTLTVWHAVKSAEQSEGCQLYEITIDTFNWRLLSDPCIHIQSTHTDSDSSTANNSKYITVMSMMLQACISYWVYSWRHLHSTSRHQLVVPRHSLSTYGHQAFSVAGLAASNSLSTELCHPVLTVSEVCWSLVCYHNW